MAPILQSIDQYYKQVGFSSQAKFYQSQVPENFTIPNFDDYKLSLRQPQVLPFEDKIEDVFTETTIRKTEPTLGGDVPEPQDEEAIIEASKQDLDFALYAKDAYEPINKRNNINNYIYMEDDSNDLLATYHNPNDDKLII